MKSHEYEPIPGLPERPPEGEQILWQGKPAWWSLTKRALHVRFVAAYFLLVGSWLAYDAYTSGEGVVIATGQAFSQLIVGAIAAGGLTLIGLWMAKAAHYTITSNRVVMRIGAAVQVTINLPFAQIESVGLRKHRDGTSDITLQMDPLERLSFLFFWPHIRPWRLSRPEPMLRSVPDGEKVAQILGEALKERLEEAKPRRRGSSSSAALEDSTSSAEAATEHTDRLQRGHQSSPLGDAR